MNDNEFMQARQEVARKMFVSFREKGIFPELRDYAQGRLNAHISELVAAQTDRDSNIITGKIAEAKYLLNLEDHLKRMAGL